MGMTDSGNPPTLDASEMWKNYDAFINLYKFWFTLFVNANLYSLGIAGGMLSFVLKETKGEVARHALALPGGICLLLSAFFFGSIPKQKQVCKFATEVWEWPPIREACVPSIGLFIKAMYGFGFFQAAVGVVCILLATGCLD